MYQSYDAGLILGGAARPRQAKANTTLIVNNTTGSVVMFTITGTVHVMALWGEVTTVLSSNVTAAHLRTNDQTANVDVTLASGVTLSSLPVGSIIYKESLAAAALIAKTNAAGFFDESTPAGQLAFTPFILVKKTAAVTTLDLRYTTTNTPATGVIQWNALWIPLSADGNLA
jgi:hypothetical protein